MLGFLKVFVRGIVCTVLLPLILAVWVLYGVYCFFAFIVMFVRSVILFFAGDNPTGELKEDIEAKKILEQKAQMEAEQAQVMSMLYQNMANQQMYGQPQPMQPQQPVQPQIVQPQPEQQPQSDFNPFGQEKTPQNELPQEESHSEEPEIEEGGSDNGQSY